MRALSKILISIFVLMSLSIAWSLTQVANIVVEHQPSAQRLLDLEVNTWPTWRKEVSLFPWSFPYTEMAYILEGEVTITPKLGTAKNAPIIVLKPGDLVTFPAGTTTYWNVSKPIYKHFHHEGGVLSILYHRVVLKVRRIIESI